MAAVEGAGNVHGLLGESALLEVTDLRTHFEIPAGVVKAVDGVSFALDRGRTLGVVGESGSGKTVLSPTIMRLTLGDNLHTEGSVMFKGSDVLQLGLDVYRLGPKPNR